MKNPALPPQANNRNDELRLVSRSLLLLALLTGVLYLRVFVSTVLAASYASGQGVVGLVALLLLIAAIAGLLAAWRWERLGGAVAIVGGLSLAVLTYLLAPEIPWLTAFFYSSPFVIAGSLSLLCWWKARFEK